jgi:dephospho-CoA kinase
MERMSAMPTKVVGVVGRNGAGKDAVADYLHDACGVVKLSAGDLVRDMAARKHLEPTRANLHAVSLQTMQREGRDVFARRLIADIEDHGWAAVAVSGVRSPHDAGAFKDYYGDSFRLVHVRVGDPGLRFQRLREREASRDPESRATFREQERQEEKHFQISRTIALADVTIDNHGSRADLHRRIEASPIWEWICGAPQAARFG